MNEDLPQSEERLLNYLEDKLSPAERAALEAELASDPSLRERLQSLQTAIDALRLYGNGDRVAAVHKQMMEERQGKKASPVVRMNHTLRWTMGVAASLLLVFAGYRLWFRPESAEELYRQAFVEYRVEPVRGDGDQPNMRPLQQSYNQRDYVTVLQQGGKAANAEDSLIVGISALKLGREKEALRWLSPIRGAYAQDAQFYSALAWLRTGDYNQAAALLKSIRNTPGHLYRDQVPDALIQKIESRN